MAAFRDMALGRHTRVRTHLAARNQQHPAPSRRRVDHLRPRLPHRPRPRRPSADRRPPQPPAGDRPVRRRPPRLHRLPDLRRTRRTDWRRNPASPMDRSAVRGAHPKGFRGVATPRRRRRPRPSPSSAWLPGQRPPGILRLLGGRKGLPPRGGGVGVRRATPQPFRHDLCVVPHRDGQEAEGSRGPQFDAHHGPAGPYCHEVLATGVTPRAGAQHAGNPDAVQNHSAQGTPPGGFHRHPAHSRQRHAHTSATRGSLLPPRQAHHEVVALHEDPCHVHSLPSPLAPGRGATQAPRGSG